MAARRRHDAGVATVWTAAWIIVLVTLGWLGLVACTVMARQHHLDGSADLVSLSGAARLQRGGDACDAVARTAAANEVGLASCVVEGEDVVVVVETAVELPFGWEGHLVAQARAGPV